MFKKKGLSIVAGMTAVIMGVGSLAYYHVNENIPVVVNAAAEEMRDISSAELVKDMGLGWNLGNTFDCIGDWITPGATSNYETAWGNPVTEQAMIKQIKKQGFKTVRIPVTWTHNVDSDNKIKAEWITRVKEVVDWCIEEDLYVIINLHHDGGGDTSAWIRNAQKDYATTEKKFVDIWKQICEEFKDYSDYLVFESMNEVEFTSVSKSEAYELLNKLNQSFVDTVRASGANNAKRHLLIAGYNTDIAQTSDSRYQMPSDPENKLILSLHYYTPSPFCVAEANVSWCTPRTTWGTADDYAELEANMQKVYLNFVNKGVPVIIGEYGVLTEEKNQKDPESIEKFLSATALTALEYGICPVLWDSGNSGDMQYFNRKTLDFNSQDIEDVYFGLSKKIENNEIDYREVEVTTYDEKTVDIAADGWIDVSGFEKKPIGVRFNISCSTDWDSQGGGGINLTGDWDNCAQFGFNSVYDTVEVMFKEEEIANMTDSIGMWFWWTLLDDPNDENSGHTSELSFKNNKVTLLFEGTKKPAETTTVTTTQKPEETTTSATTTQKPEETTTSVTTTQKPEETTTSATTTQKPEETTVTTNNVPVPQNKVGDFNADGETDLTDLTLLSLYLLGDSDFNEVQLSLADVNADGSIDVADLAHYKQFVSKDNVVLGK